MAAHADTALKRFEHIRDSVPWADDDADFYARGALEYGLRLAAMEAEWARRLIGEVDGRSRS